MRDVYKLNWKCLFGHFEREFKNIDGYISVLQPSFTKQQLEEYYTQIKQFLRQRVNNYYGTHTNHNLDKKISTWAFKIQRANILKYGTDEDKMRVGAASIYQKPKPRGLKRRGTITEKPKYF